MSTPRAPHRLAVIDARIHKIKAELAAIEAMRPGTLSRQYKDPARKRGAYYQLSYTHEMKSRTEYLPREFLGEARQQIAAHKRFKRLCAQWIALSLQRWRLTIALSRRQT